MMIMKTIMVFKGNGSTTIRLDHADNGDSHYPSLRPKNAMQTCPWEFVTNNTYPTFEPVFLDINRYIICPKDQTSRYTPKCVDGTQRFCWNQPLIRNQARMNGGIHKTCHELFQPTVFVQIVL